MTDISYIYWNGLSDKAANEMLGGFVRQSRLRQGKTQDRLAREAGIARSTLSLFERGENSSLLVFIQLLRVLGFLHLLNEFQAREQLSPLQLAKLEHSKRQRVKAKSGKRIKS